MFKTFHKDLIFRPYVLKLNVQRILEMRKSSEQLKANGALKVLWDVREERNLSEKCDLS